MAQFKTVVPVLRMFDPVKMREFYVDFLGFTVDWEHRFAPDLPLYVQLSFGGILVHLTEHHGDASPGSKIMIHITGLRDYQAKLLGKQYGFARPSLEDQPWGATTMTVTDPFYNRLVFTQYHDETIVT